MDASAYSWQWDLRLPKTLRPKQKSTIPAGEIISIRDRRPTSNELRRYSIFPLLYNKPRSRDANAAYFTLDDPRFGPDEKRICGHCTDDAKTTEKCAGHTAHMDLTMPCSFPKDARKIEALIHSTCTNCSAQLIQTGSWTTTVDKLLKLAPNVALPPLLETPSVIHTLNRHVPQPFSTCPEYFQQTGDEKGPAPAPGVDWEQRRLGLLERRHRLCARLMEIRSDLADSIVAADKEMEEEKKEKEEGKKKKKKKTAKKKKKKAAKKRPKSKKSRGKKSRKKTTEKQEDDDDDDGDLDLWEEIGEDVSDQERVKLLRARESDIVDRRLPHVRQQLGAMERYLRCCMPNVVAQYNAVDDLCFALENDIGALEALHDASANIWTKDKRDAMRGDIEIRRTQLLQAKASRTEVDKIKSRAYEWISQECVKKYVTPERREKEGDKPRARLRYKRHDQELLYYSLSAELQRKLEGHGNVDSDVRLALVKNILARAEVKSMKAGGAGGIYCAMAFGGCGTVQPDVERDRTVKDLYAMRIRPGIATGHIWDGGVPYRPGQLGLLPLTGAHIQSILRRINDADQKVLGHDPRLSRPEALLTTVLAIPPTSLLRESSSVLRTIQTIIFHEESQWEMWRQIQAQFPAYVLRCGDINLDPLPNALVREFRWHTIMIQHAISAVVRYVQPIPTTTKKIAGFQIEWQKLRHPQPIVKKPLHELTDGKPGIWRRGIFGKALMYSARGIVCNKARLPVHSIGMDERLARRLRTKICRVTPGNLAEVCRQADAIFERRQSLFRLLEKFNALALDGNRISEFHLEFTDEDMAMRDVYPNCGLIYKGGADSTDKRSTYELREPYSRYISVDDVVEFSVSTGDVLAVSRPPALHKMSNTAMTAYVIPSASTLARKARSLKVGAVEESCRQELIRAGYLSTHNYGSLVFYLSASACSIFNADFDGDAIQVAVIVSLEPAAEASLVMGVQPNILGCEANSSIFPAVQSTLTVAYERTRANELLSMHQFDYLWRHMHMWTEPVWNDLYKKERPEPAVWLSPSQPRWTMRQLYAMLFPKGMQYQRTVAKFSAPQRAGETKQQQKQQPHELKQRMPLDQIPVEWPDFEYRPDLVDTDADECRPPVIVNSEWVSGTATAADLGVQEMTMQKQIALKYGSLAALHFINDVAALGRGLYGMQTSSVTFRDLMIDHKTRTDLDADLTALCKRQEIEYVDRMRLELDDAAAEFELAQAAGGGRVWGARMMLERQQTLHRDESFLMDKLFDRMALIDKHVADWIAGQRLPASPVADPYVGQNLLSMIVAGSKGKPADWRQIAVTLGSQLVDNRLITTPLAGRTLPLATSSRHMLEHRGFVRSSYVGSRSPADFLQDGSSARKDSADSSGQVFISGKINRAAAKALGEMFVQWNGTVCDTEGRIISFCYGIEGTEVERLRPVSVPLVDWLSHIKNTPEAKEALLMQPPGTLGPNVPSVDVLKKLAAPVFGDSGGNELAQLCQVYHDIWFDCVSLYIQETDHKLLMFVNVDELVQEVVRSGDSDKHRHLPLYTPPPPVGDRENVMMDTPVGDRENVMMDTPGGDRKVMMMMDERKDDLPVYIAKLVDKLCEALHCHENELYQTFRLPEFKRSIAELYIRSTLNSKWLINHHGVRTHAQVDAIIRAVAYEFKMSRHTPGRAVGVDASCSVFRPVTQNTLNRKHVQSHQVKGFSDVLAIKAALTQHAVTKENAILTFRLRPTPLQQPKSPNLVHESDTAADVLRLFQRIRPMSVAVGSTQVVAAQPTPVRTRFWTTGFDLGGEAKVIYADADESSFDEKHLVLSPRASRLVLSAHRCNKYKLDVASTLVRMRQLLPRNFALYGDHLPNNGRPGRGGVYILALRRIQVRSDVPLMATSTTQEEEEEEEKKKKKQKKTTTKRVRSEEEKEKEKEKKKKKKPVKAVLADAVAGEGKRRKKRPRLMLYDTDRFDMQVLEAAFAESVIDTGIIELDVDTKQRTVRMRLAPDVVSPQKLRALMCCKDVDTFSVSYTDTAMECELFGIGRARISLFQRLKRAVNEISYVNDAHLMTIANWMVWTGFPTSIDNRGLLRMCHDYISNATFEASSTRIIQASYGADQVPVKTTTACQFVGANVAIGTQFQKIVPAVQRTAAATRTEAEEEMVGDKRDVPYQQRLRDAMECLSKSLSVVS